MHIPDALLVDLVAAAGIILEQDEPFWYAMDGRSGSPLAQGSDAGRVAREALAALRQRLDRAEGAVLRAEQQRALGAAEGAEV